LTNNNNNSIAFNDVSNPSRQILIRDDSFTTVENIQESMANEPIICIYPLSTPLVYHLTPQEITALSSDNTMWADTGDITVTYRK
jgi:hypothetical protein